MKSLDDKSIDQRLNTIAKLKEKVLSNIEKDDTYLKQLNNISVRTKKQKGNQVLLAPAPKPQDLKVKTNAPIQLTDKQKLEIKKKHLALRKEVCDEQFFDRLKPLLDEIPESNGSRYYKKINTNIGIIADEFLFNSYNGVANFLYVNRENYKEHHKKLDVLLIVTTWRGLHNEWRGLGNPKIKKHRDELYKIMDYYRKQGTKIVFYSKEDPVNYHIFIDIAKHCDYIFTTAIEKIKDYQKDCNNENVFLLEFGVNPLYHNPVGIKKHPKLPEVLFTGSWYEKYPHRQVDTRTLFDGVIEGNKDLKIIDRNYDLELIQYFFPDEYVKYVSPSIKHTYLQKFHKMFDWAINLNSIQESNTMFANRIYELQALGNILLSNYSVGVNNKFPGVFLIDDKHEVKDIFDAYTVEDVFQHQVSGIRQVMSDKTTFHRIEHLLKTIEVKHEALPKRKVAVLVKEKHENIEKMFNLQTYPYKALYTEEEFTEELKQQHDMITFFDDKIDYNIFYLEDMVNGFKYTDSEYITKDAYYQDSILHEGIEFDYVSEMKDKHKTLFWSETYSLQQLLDMDGHVQLVNGFSIDHFSLNDYKPEIVENPNYKLSVIIPTYNNGNHLMNKCFNSLRRSSMFKDMEIIIIDDGSTDDVTPKVVHYLTEHYSNVKSYFYNDRGSGSASRPRNKAVEFATAPYITYLDPDNEAINDGFAKLYKQIEEDDYDLVIGNMIRLDTKRLIFDYYRTAVQFYGGEVLTDGIDEYLVNTEFKAMSIQALIVKREIIQENMLKMVEGAVGQDTIFFQELLLHSDKVKVLNEPIHIYYAAVEGSAVNTITKRFFERYLRLEKYRVQMLEDNDLLEAYVEQRFAYYFQNWYLNKLNLVQEGDELESVKLLGEIVDLYGDINDLYERNTKVDVSLTTKFLALNKKKDYKKIIENFSN